MDPAGQHKNYFFETESRRLKDYYLSHPAELLNRRIIFNNSTGTVRFIGELCHEGKPANCAGEMWVGLEWDEEGRGKHNGTVNGHQYFKCKDKWGSMVKFEKIEFGYKLQTALFKRYFRAEELHHAKDIFESLKSYKKELAEQNEEGAESKSKELAQKKNHKIEYDSEAYINTLKESKKIMVEFVGFDEVWTKINNLQKLHSISLAECRICDLGPRGHLADILSFLKVLSLEDNLISHWDQVFQLGIELKHLTQLSLTNNKIEPPESPVESREEIKVVGHDETYSMKDFPVGQIFPRLKCLILINIGLTWKDLMKVSAAFDESIEELILCKNDLSDIENLQMDKINKMKQLTFVNLEETKLTSFQAVNAFSSLPHLEKIILNRNDIKELGHIEGFHSMKHLSVQYCGIDDPVVIYQISKLRELESLNIKNNPVGERLGNSHVRMRAVAEITKLKVINGTMLRKYDRKDCEIYYLRETFREYFALKNVPDYDYDFEDFMKFCEFNHPNIQHLIKKYGNPYEVEEKKEIKQIIKEEVKQNVIKKGTGMLNITICNRELDTTEKKKIPLSWTISSLRNFFAKTHKIPVNMQILLVKLDENSPEEEISEDHKTVGFYNVSEESTIIIARKP